MLAIKHKRFLNTHWSLNEIEKEFSRSKLKEIWS